MKLEGAIYCRDNLEWMGQFPDEFVDLCYIDPPFFSNRRYEVIFKDGQEIRPFEDRWKGGIEHYVEWMRERVFEFMKRPRLARSWSSGIGQRRKCSTNPRLADSSSGEL